MSAPETFGASLRRLRIAAGMTQERLAERAAISAAGVAALESGRRKSPRLSTVGLLGDALQLDPEARADLFELAAGAASTVHRADRAIGRADAPGGSGSFVGRAEEYQALATAWDRRTRLVLVSGEAGVGKTRLVEELVRQLEPAPTVLRGRCTPEMLGAYEPFVEPIRQALARFEGVLPPGLAELGRLIPGLVDANQHAPVPSRAEPGLERRLLFEAVATLFRGVGALLVVVDDLQWADPGSLALLAFITAEPELSEMVVIGTVRSTDLTPATASALAGLRRHCPVVRIALHGLDRAEVARLVGAVAGDAVPDGLPEIVADATSGNPLYVEELTEHLLQSGFDPTQSRSVPVPDGIRDTIGLRVESLSVEGRALLRAGAVLGPVFDLTVAGPLARLEGQALAAAVEDALLSGLLVEQSVSTAAFSHGLVATTVYESMSWLRRVELHRQAAISLGERGPQTTAAIVDIARHWSLVAESDPLMRSIAAHWTVLAGDAAASAAAIDEAIVCYERAAALWVGSTAEHADTLIRLGTAQAAIGLVAEADRRFAAALRMADSIEDAPLYARAALGLSATVRYGSSDPERIAELESAIARLGPDEMVLRPAVLATLMRQLGFLPTDEAYRRRNEAAALVLEAVSVDDVPAELLMALGALRDSIPVDHPVALGRLARQILEVATARRDLPAISTGWYRQAWSALELGQAELWRHAVAEYRTVAEALRRPYELALSANMLAAVAQVEGRYDDAEALGQEALRHAATIEDANVGAVYLANSVLRGLDTGLAEPMRQLMLAARPDYVGVPTFEAGLTLTAAVAGDLDLARQLLDEQVGERCEGIRRDAEWLPVLGFLAGACAAAAEDRHAAVLRELLVESPARVVRVGPVGAWFGPVDHHIGALSRLVGDLDEAERRLEAALAVEDEMNGGPFRVRTTVELALVHGARGGAKGQARNDALWQSATAMAHALGLPLLVPSDSA